MSTSVSDDAKAAGFLASFDCHANLSVVDWTGKHKHIRRLYCSMCKRRFTERQGTLLRYYKLPEATVVRIVWCLGHGCSVESAANNCDADPRTVDRILERAGRRAEDFHRHQLERLPAPPEAVQLDELQGRVSPTPPKKEGRKPARGRRGLGRVWAHAALAVVSRFLIDVRVGHRDLTTAVELVASVALCVPAGPAPPLLLVDNHLPYASALLQVFGEVLHRRRKQRHGRKKYPALKPPAGLLAGVVHKVCDASGNLVKA